MNVSSKKRISLFALILIIATFALSIPGLFFYYNIQNLIVEELGRNATSVAASVAELVEQRIDDYKTLVTIDDYENTAYDEEYYFEMLASFSHINEQIGADYLYTEKYIDDSTVAYIFDSEDPESDYFSPIGSTDLMSEYELVAYRSGENVATPIEKYEVWGTYLSGYAPIIDKETNEVIGLVGVDYSLAYVSKLILSVKIILTITITFLILTTSFLVYKLLDLRSEALNKDYLTGLFSKRYQEAKLRKMIKEARQKSTPLSLIMLDVDYFKEINDHFGHYIGDQVLKDVANVIMYNTRNVDICSRYGGDEFLIILPNTLPEVAASIGDSIKRSVLKLSIADEKSQVSVSIGIALWNHSSEIEEFIMQADKAMYVSKNTGKNRITIYK
ncbi:MAG: GGDEF domain-containing protein [Candidatus Izemoplasmatales bacterium]